MKCVCKSWLSLISNNPHFTKLHLHYAQHDTSVNRYNLFIHSSPFRSIDQDAFCYGNNHLTRQLTCSAIAVPHTQLKFIGSCNGLIAAFWHDEHICYNMNPNIHILVWNPTTGDFKKFSTLDLSGSMLGCFYGFGYDPHLDRYKIVRGLAFIDTTGTDITMEVFDMKAKKWKSSKDVRSNFSLNGVFSSTNGFLHWLVDLKPDSDEEVGNIFFDSGQELGIVSFDLGQQKFLEMVPVPDNLTKKLSGLSIEGVGDDVWVCTNPHEGWMMKRDGSEISWRKLYSFSVDTLPRCENWIDVIWAAKNGNVVLDVDGRELVLFNLEEQSSLEYGLNSTGYNAITYLETLVSPNAI